MTVASNVEFGLDVRRVARAERRRAVDRALRQVHLSDLAHRKPGQLSGGQQQRVALARALVVRPRVLLLDEPLSNLDAGLRMQMRSEIRSLCAEAGLTALYVTHDQHEAMAVADRIALMRDGEVEQVGTPREIYERPHSLFAARFMGETGVLEATVLRAGSRVELDCPLGGITAARLPDGVGEGDHVLCSVRPECWSLDPPGGRGAPGRVVRSTFLGERTELSVDTKAGPLKVFLPGGTGGKLGEGDEVTLSVAPECVVVLPREGEGP